VSAGSIRSGGPVLDRALVVRAFQMMATHLARQRVRGKIMLAGGAVMALVYDVDRVTRDVDGLISAQHGAVITAAHRVASELELPRGWLNEGVSTYLSTQPDPGAAMVFDEPGLSVYAVSGEHMIALKARAARAQDVADLRVLIEHFDLTSASQIFTIAAQFFPDDPMPPKSVALIEDLFDASS